MLSRGGYISLLLLLLLCCGRVRAIKPVRPEHDVVLTEREDAPLRPKWQIQKGNREDTLRMKQAGDTLTVAEIKPDTARIATKEAPKPQGVDLEVDKKIVHTESLGLAESHTLKEILEVIPELLNRGSDDLLSNFSLQIDDQDVGLSKNVILGALRLAEIDNIEIMTLPAASVQKNGEGGVINVHLKPVAKGLSGSVTTDLYTNFHNTVDLSPAVFVNYGSEKWQMRASAIVEYYRPESHEQQETRIRDANAIDGRDTLTLLYDTARTHYIQETAKLQFDYQPSSRDRLTFVVWESMRWQTTANQSLATTYRPFPEHSDIFQETRVPSMQTSTADRKNVLAQIKYHRDYLTGGRFETSVLYNYRNTADNSIKKYPVYTDSAALTQKEIAQTSQSPHEIQLNLSTKHAVCPERLGVYDSEMWLTCEVNTSYTDSRSTLYQDGFGTDLVYSGQNIGLRSRQLYVSPVVQWDYRIGSVSLQAGVRYQLFRRHLSTDTQPDWAKNEHDVTANINAVWKITQEHTVRLSVARNITRPTDEQMFPYTYYLPSTQQLLVGNDSLHAAHFHNAGINYLYAHNFRSAGEGRILTNVGIEYIRADGLIKKRRKTYDAFYGPVPCLTYVNLSVGNVLSTTASVFMRYKIFSLSFSGNLYANFQETGDTNDYYWYYNLSLSPIFAFRHDWTLSGKMMYNSKIETRNSFLGDCFYVQLRLSKDIGNWNIHMELNDIFDARTVDQTRSIEEQYIPLPDAPTATVRRQQTVTRTYDLYKRLLMIGMVYHF